MKKIVFVLVFFTQNVSAQNVEILLIGAMHDYSGVMPQDFSQIHNKIRQFKPDGFFGEYRSKEDERLLMNYWCKSFNNERIERLKAKRMIAENDLPKTIAALKETIAKNPNDWKARVDIAHAYFLDQDVANAYFQMWQVYNNKNLLPNQDIFEYSKLVLTPTVDSLHKAIKNYGSSEYNYIAFPMMLEFGFKEIYPMDCQIYDLNYSNAVDTFWMKYDIFKKDTVNGYTLEFKKMEKAMYAEQTKRSKREKTDNHATESINTDESGLVGLTYDYLLPSMYDAQGFPKEAILSARHWWNMRNQGMCDNTVTRARALGKKRIVIVVGANHRLGMQAIFEKMPNVKVLNINQFGQ